MSIKPKQLSRNQQQKLLAHSGLHFALLYIIYCLMCNKKTAKSSFPQNPYPTLPSTPALADAHRHTHTRTISQQPSLSWLHDSSKCSKCQPTGMGQEACDEATSPNLHGSLFWHWQSSYNFVAVKGSYKACSVLGMSGGWTAQVRRCKCCCVISDQNPLTRSTVI